MKRLILLTGICFCVSSCTPQHATMVRSRDAILDSTKISQEVKDEVAELPTGFWGIQEHKYQPKFDYILNHPSDSSAEHLAVLRGRYWVGMSKEQAKASLARLHTINRTTTPWGTHEQWAFDRLSCYDDIYLYFDGDTCTAIQD